MVVTNSDTQYGTLTDGYTYAMPAFSAAPDPDAFGDVRVSITSANQPITVTNTGVVDLVFPADAVTLGGLDPGEFAIDEDRCSDQSLAPTQSCVMDVTFTPTSAGAKSATLDFTDNADDSPQSVALTGAGVQSAVGLSATGLTFGEQLIGTGSGAQTLTVTNTGTAVLTFPAGGVSLSGTDSSQFALGSDTCTAQSVAVADTCTVSVTFTPATAGGKSAALSLISDAPSSPDVVALTGAGTTATTQPAVGLSPNGLTFGDQSVGTASAAQAVTVTNTGGAPLVFAAGGVTLAGSPKYFTISADNCAGQTVAPGGTCSTLVRFTPTSDGTHNATLAYADNAPGSPQQVTLTGKGSDPLAYQPAPAVVDAGGASGTTNHVGVPVTLTTSTRTMSQTVAGAGWTVTFNTATGDGRPLVLVGGVMQTVPSLYAQVAVTGFAPGTTANLWLSPGTRLGSLTVDGSGAGAGRFAIPATTAAGGQTLQLVGLIPGVAAAGRLHISAAAAVVSANLGTNSNTATAVTNGVAHNSKLRVTSLPKCTKHYHFQVQRLVMTRRLGRAGHLLAQGGRLRHQGGDPVPHHQLGRGHLPCDRAWRLRPTHNHQQRHHPHEVGNPVGSHGPAREGRLVRNRPRWSSAPMARGRRRLWLCQDAWGMP